VDRATPRHVSKVTLLGTRPVSLTLAAARPSRAGRRASWRFRLQANSPICR